MGTSLLRKNSLTEGTDSFFCGIGIQLFHIKKFIVKAILSGHSKRRPKKVFNTDYRLMQVKSIEECSILHI